MALVTATRLNNYMNNPTWSDDQTTEAGKICEQIEGRLSGLLNTPLTPEPFSETAGVLQSGLVATKYPVFSVSSINGTAIADGDPLPTGWIIQDNRLRATTTSVELAGFTLGSLISSLGTHLRVDGIGSVNVEYLAGWGPKPSLVDAILVKAKAVMTNRHDDTVTIRELDATPPPPEEEYWSEAELAPLGIYRNLAIFR
jgi:hypothetical protein